MPKSLTLKNLPDGLHARLETAAKRHRRSLSSEERLAQVRALRQGQPLS